MQGEVLPRRTTTEQMDPANVETLWENMTVGGRCAVCEVIDEGVYCNTNISQSVTFIQWCICDEIDSN